MKKNKRFLVKLNSDIEGVCHISTSMTCKRYNAEGISGRSVTAQRIRKLRYEKSI